MSLIARLGRRFKRLLNSDITRVLVLDTRTFVPSDTSPGLVCSRLDASHLSTLASHGLFGLSERFVKDFQTFGFVGIEARWNDEPVGVCFLAEGLMPARHNRGGSAFKGIGLTLPENAFFLFKVEVRPQWRGRRVHATMIRHAIEHFGTRRLRTMVTTTNWRNRAFLVSARRQGFKPCGFASELRIAGAHLYRLPAPVTTFVDDVASVTDPVFGHQAVFRAREKETDKI